MQKCLLCAHQGSSGRVGSVELTYGVAEDLQSVEWVPGVDVTSSFGHPAGPHLSFQCRALKYSI